jgi:UDP-N-acetylglucosamine acyltransferase
VKAHKTALVHPDAIINSEVEIGPNTIIGKDVTLGKGTIIGANVIIDGTTRIGENCKIYTGAVIGTPPQDLKYRGEETKVIIGDNNTIREYVTINRATAATGETKIGNNNLIMAYAHVAHDCVIGNWVVLANLVTLAGHVVIEDKAIVGGSTPIHQFIHIGTMSIVGGLSRVVKDIPPYCKAAGSPMKMFGLNSIGLDRHNFSEEVKIQLKKAYKIVFRSKLNTTQAIQKLEEEKNLCDEVSHFINFIKESERGICKE